MITNALQKYRLFAFSVLLFTLSSPALAKIDSFTISSVVFPSLCNQDFIPNQHFRWDTRSDIPIVSGERIYVTLYGTGADFALDADGDNIHEFISGRGTEALPGAPIMFGSRVETGYVRVSVRAAESDGLGRRTVIVKWLGGEERIPIRIVDNCKRIFNNPYRNIISPSGGGTGVTLQPSDPDLMPSLQTPALLTRPLSEIIPTINGGMFRINDAFCKGLQSNQPQMVSVPNLTWGVVGVNIQNVNAAFNVQLIDATDRNASRVIDTLQLPQEGFPDNQPIVLKNNFPGRSTTIHVIKDPKFKISNSVTETMPGCFTDPLTPPQTMDPRVLLIKVDPNNRINEGEHQELNNVLRF